MASTVRALEACLAEAALLERALLAVRQGIVLVGPNDEVVITNPASAGLIRPAATLGQLTPHGLQALVRQARAAEGTVNQEVEVGWPMRTVAATASPLGSGHVLLTLEDVTQSRRTDAMRRDFVAAASHELRTPVSAIVATTDALVLALGRDEDAVARFAKQLGDSAEQLASLVRDLLDLSRLEGSDLPHERVELAGMAREEVARHSRTVHVDLEEIEVQGSRADLALALRNLLDNALRHTPPEGTVSVRVRSSGSEAWIEVSDTGEGISSRDLPRIFERFYRVDSARSRGTGGTGLGLAIVRHVAESHHGSAEAESELGAGSTFRIRLPLSPRS